LDRVRMPGCDGEPANSGLGAPAALVVVEHLDDGAEAAKHGDVPDGGRGLPGDDEPLSRVVCGREHVCQVTLPLIRRLPPLFQHVGAAADADEVPGSVETAESSRVVSGAGDFVAVDDVEFGVEWSCHADTVAARRGARVARSANR